MYYIGSQKLCLCSTGQARLEFQLDWLANTIFELASTSSLQQYLDLVCIRLACSTSVTAISQCTMLTALF